MFIKVQELQIVDVLISLKNKFYLMSGLKFTLSDVILFLPSSLSGL